MATAIVKPGYREFAATRTDGTKVSLSVRLPHPKELQAADLEMSATFNRSMEAGLPVQQRIIRKLRANGLWTDENQTELEDLQLKLAILEKQFREDTFKDDGERAAAQAERRKVQADFAELRSEFESMLEHTADAKANIAHRNFLIACTIEHTANDTEEPRAFQKGDRFFSSLDAFLAERDSNLVQRIIYEYLACQSNVPSEWKEADDKAAAEKKAADEKAAVAAVEPAVVVAPAPPAPPVIEIIAAPPAMIQPAETSLSGTVEAATAAEHA